MYHWEKHLDQENIKVKILDNDRLNIYSLYNPLTINVSIFSNSFWASKKIFLVAIFFYKIYKSDQWLQKLIVLNKWALMSYEKRSAPSLTLFRHIIGTLLSERAKPFFMRNLTYEKCILWCISKHFEK